MLNTALPFFNKLTPANVCLTSFGFVQPEAIVYEYQVFKYCSASGHSLQNFNNVPLVKIPFTIWHFKINK